MTLTKIGTDGVKDDAITSGKIPANAVGTSEIADDAVTGDKIAAQTINGSNILDGSISAAELGSDAVTTAKLADGAVNGARIADQAITLDKLVHGTSSNDGKFLRANNGADPTFETITGTTINNNADNRVITGSGTANTLEGEANLTFNGTNLLTVHVPSATGEPAINFTNSDTGTGSGNGFGLGINSSESPYIWNRENTDLRIATNNTERMRIDSSGNVAIGNTNAQQLLHVWPDTANTSSSYIRITAGDRGSGTGLDLGHDSSGNCHVNAVSNAHLSLSTNNTERLKIDSSGVIQTANKTITGGNNNAIQNIKCLGTWSGVNSVGKSIELISGYDSNVKMAAISYNLTDTSTGGTYGGDLNLHSQPLYGSPTTPIPIALKVKSNGCVQLPKNPSFRADLNNSQNNTQLASGAQKLSHTLGHTLDQVRWDVGSNYTSSNSRFTCPVDGTYVFHLYLGGHSSSESQSYVGNEIYVNGTRYNGAWNNQDAGYQYSERTYTLKLEDGDYVEPGYELSNNNGWRVIGSTGVSKRYTGFEGYLVG